MKDFLLNRSNHIALVVWAVVASWFSLWQALSDGSYWKVAHVVALFPLMLLSLRWYIVFTQNFRK